MRKLLHLLIDLSGIVAGILLLTMVVVMFVNIVMRQFGALFEGSEEIATFSMVGLAFLGLPAVYRAGMHVRVETLYLRLSDVRQRAINIFCVIVAVLVCLVLIYFSAFLVWDSYKFGDTSIGLLAMPLWIPQLPIPIGLALLTLALLDDLGQLVRGEEASFQTSAAAEEARHAE